MASFAAFPIRAAAAQLPAGATPPTAEVLAARIDSVVKTDILRRGFPSISIAVTRGGRTLLERAWGVAEKCGVIGSSAAWVFAAPQDPREPLQRHVAKKWLLRAEKLAKLDHLKHGGFHMFVAAGRRSANPSR
jgi:hypothetical protein